MKQIKLLKTDGEVEILAKPPSWKELKTLVGGWVEQVRVLDRIESGRPVLTLMFVNEEGLVLGLPRNQAATVLYQALTRYNFPTVSDPLDEAKRIYKLQCEKAGMQVIDTTSDLPGYASDPYIAGPAVYFEGWTEEEVETLYG